MSPPFGAAATAVPMLTPARARPTPRLVGRAAWGLGGAAVLGQVAYPLVEGPARDHLTILTVYLALAAVAVHCAYRHGTRTAAALVGTTLAVALATEVVGVHLGLPFGRYSYGDSLGPRALGVPLVVPCAWVMTAYPALVVARRLVRGRLAVVLLAGWALASWDVFLDPQMVAAGHWHWYDATPALPGSPGIPLTNYAGWLAVSVVLMALLDRLLPPPTPRASDDPLVRGRCSPDARDGGDLLPGLSYLWTFGSQVLANLVFFGRPAIALLGGVAMGLVALPYAATLARRRR